MASSNGRERILAPSPGLHFVNIAPVTREERERNRKVIRSAAMRTFRREQRLESLKEPAVPSELREAELDPSSPSGSKSRPHEAEQGRKSSSPYAVSKVSLSGSFSLTRRVTKVKDDVGISSSVQNSLQRTPLVKNIGAGRVDPFRTYPMEFTGPHINEIMDHSTTYLWPGFRPPSNAAATHISAAWLAEATEQPIAMHALLFGGAVHRDVLRNHRLSMNDPVQLFHKVETIRLIKEALKTPEKVIIDDLILACLTLSANEVETMVSSAKKSVYPFVSPLPSLQWLNVYGRMSPIFSHTTAMRTLVACRGGLEKIELDGLPEVLLLSDILGATQRMSKPHFPLLDRWKHADSPPGTLATFLPQRHLAAEFRKITSIGLNSEALVVLEAMAEHTAVIDSHCKGVVLISDMAGFIDRRNVLQHRLMSLPRSEELSRGDISSLSMYEVIRHTAMIYSAAVIFPIPPHQGLFPKLAHLVHSILDASRFDPFWKACPKTVLWVLVLGGIAAVETDDRPYYVHSLVFLSRLLKITRWEDVVEVLLHHLWLDSACDAGGRALWREVVRERIILPDGI